MTRTATALLALATAAFALPAAAEEIKFMADLSGEAQVPPVETEGTGMADVTVDTEAMTVTWMVTYQDLTGEPVAAHFHGPATEEETAPPVIDLTADMEASASATAAASTTVTSDGETQTETSTDTSTTEDPVPQDITEGSSEITEEQLEQLRDGLWYVNVHTEMHPDGEIRGQVMEGEADMEAMESMMEAMDAASN